MNREIYLIKMDFCKFNCPFKDKRNIKTVLEEIDDIMYNAEIEYDDRFIVKEDIEEEFNYLGCKLCPLESFINRLEDEKIIGE